MRAKAFMEAGGSPAYTLTEDFALGMELRMLGWQCRYVQEYLAVGEAPSEIRNCFQQRSRWIKVRASPPSSLCRPERLSGCLLDQQQFEEHLPCAQGHLQVILNLAHSPLLQRRLRLIDRLMYCSGIWSYVVGVLTSFVFIAVPFVTIWIGAQPLSPQQTREEQMQCKCPGCCSMNVLQS